VGNFKKNVYGFIVSAYLFSPPSFRFHLSLVQVGLVNVTGVQWEGYKAVCPTWTQR
jgi:hypothetical protein